MSDRNERLIALATALTDGTPIDWAEAEATAATESELVQIRRLRLVQGIGAHAGRTEVQPPETWGPLRIISLLAEGRFGIVYRAWDPRLEREVALKLLKYQEPGDSHAVAVGEGRALARIRHPNVVTVYGAERVGDRVGVWMELVGGRTLSDEMTDRGPLSEGEVARIGIDLCRALAAVHEAGLVHRDVKVQNVMREAGGRIVLMDFGTGRDADTTSASELAGTPLYLAPEVLRGQVATRRSDLYSLGVLLFHLLTGAFPVSGRTLRDIRDNHARGERMTVRDAAPHVSAALAAVITRALADDPADRFDDAAAMRIALEACVSDPPSASRRRSVLPAAAVLLLATAGLAFWLAYGRALPSAGSTRLLLAGSEAWNATASADGRFASYWDVATRSLVRREISGGTIEALVLVSAAGGPAALGTPMTRDGGRVAYGWWNNDSERAELRAVAPGRDPTLIAAGSGGTDVRPLNWSFDGRWIAYETLHYDTVRRGLAIAASDGSDGTVLHTLDWRGTTTAVWSPDGAWLAFDQPTDATTSRRDVFVVSTREPQVAAVVDGPFHETVAGWSPDGSELWFLSDRAGAMSLWAQPMSNGLPVGDARLLEPDLSTEPLAVGDDGSLIHRVTTRFRTLQVSDVDTATGELVAGPRRPRADPLATLRLAGWSATGESLAYVTSRYNAQELALVLLDERAPSAYQEIPLPVSNLFTMEWSPSGHAFAARALDLEGRQGIFLIDRATGRPEPVVLNDGTRFHFTPHWSPAGDRLYYTVGTGGELGSGHLASRDVLTGDVLAGEEHVVIRQPEIRTNDGRGFPGMRDLRISPDGAWLAGLNPGTSDDPESTIWVVRLADRTAREILRVKRRNAFTHNGGLRWMPDSRGLLVNRAASPEDPTRELWLLPIDGSPQVRLDVGASDIVDGGAIDIHPNGSRIAFTAGPEPEAELRILEVRRTRR